MKRVLNWLRLCINVVLFPIGVGLFNFGATHVHVDHPRGRTEMLAALFAWSWLSGRYDGGRRVLVLWIHLTPLDKPQRTRFKFRRVLMRRTLWWMRDQLAGET